MKEGAHVEIESHCSDIQLVGRITIKISFLENKSFQILPTYLLYLRN